jgi:hypothetical protein
MTTHGVRPLTLAATVMCLLAACSPPSPTQTPAGSAPGVSGAPASEAPNPNSSPNADASPGTADIAFDYGPGTFNFLAPASGLSDLNSYRSTLTMSFAGNEGGKPSQWTNTYVMLVTGERAARQLTFSDLSADGADTAAPVYRAELSGIAYEKHGDAACTSSAVFAADSLAQRWEPASFLPGVTGAVESGTETVDGVVATRYDFDQRAFGSLPESTSSGQMWVAKDGGYIVRYELTTNGSAEYFGEGSDGTLTLEYELTDVNAAPAIALPEDCATDTPDAPLLPDATDVLRAPTLVSYTSASRPDEAIAFYHDQLTSLDWISIADPTVGDIATVETFRRGADQVSVVVGMGDAGTSIRLVFEPIPQE